MHEMIFTYIEIHTHGTAELNTSKIAMITLIIGFKSKDVNTVS